MRKGRAQGGELKDVYLHYERLWGTHYSVQRLTGGPIQELGPDFRVIELPPHSSQSLWTYATVGMSLVPEACEGYGLELHLLAPAPAPAQVELLTVIAHYHITDEPLGWGHTVSFGRPWLPDSSCSYGLILLPYLDGPELAWMGEPRQSTRFLWLIPITEAERNYVGAHGVEALEIQFEAAQFDYLNPFRDSVVR
jgi:hypothetical protein